MYLAAQIKLLHCEITKCEWQRDEKEMEKRVDEVLGPAFG